MRLPHCFRGILRSRDRNSHGEFFVLFLVLVLHKYTLRTASLDTSIASQPFNTRYGGITKRLATVAYAGSAYQKTYAAALRLFVPSVHRPALLCATVHPMHGLLVDTATQRTQRAD